MKFYKKYKDSVQGFQDVSETVKTVEKIAASSVHFLEKEVANLDAYTDEINRTLARLASFYKNQSNVLLEKKYAGKKLLIILTGDRGLVGGLWHKVINVFLENIKQYQSIIIVGSRGKNYLKEENISIINYPVNFSDIPQKEEVEKIVDYVIDDFKKGKFVSVNILYPSFISLAEQKPEFIQFLPFDFKFTPEATSSEGLPIFEPSKQKIFNNLLQKYISVFFYKIVIEAKLSELSARTVAMEHAATKTEDLVKKITLTYVKERRRIITQRQLESFSVHKF